MGVGEKFHDVVTITLPKVPDGKGGFYDEYMDFLDDSEFHENFYTMDGKMYLYLDVTAYEPQDGGFDKDSAKVLHNEKIRLTDQQTEDLLKNHSVTIDTSDVSADKAGNVYWAVSLCTDAVTPEAGKEFLSDYKDWTSLKELPAVWATHKVGIPEETTKVTVTPTPTSTPTPASTPEPKPAPHGQGTRADRRKRVRPRARRGGSADRSDRAGRRSGQEVTHRLLSRHRMGW